MAGGKSPSPATAKSICGTQATSTTWRRPMRTREALLPDAERIYELISSYSGDGTLLPRSLAEICENVRDFIVLEEAGHIIGCGALHLYGTHLAEIRSITVDPSYQKRGGGELLVQSLMSEARQHDLCR